MRRALVTGAAGFIGSTLAKSLVADGGFDVVGVDRFSPYYDPEIKRGNLSGLESDRFSLVCEDLNEIDLAPLLDGVDVVFHLAGQPGVRPSWGRTFDSYMQDNVLATQRLLEACVGMPSPPKFVYSSSSSVYGDADKFPVQESALPKPVSPYGVTKLAAEHLCGLYGVRRGLDTVSLRYFTVYGAGQRPDMAFTRMCFRAAVGEPFTVYGTGEQIRDFTHVSDVVSANVKASQASTAPGTVLNISGGSATSLNQCIEIVAGYAGRPIARNETSWALGDAVRTGGDSTLARREIGWEPRVSLEVGLLEQYSWAVDNIDLLRAAVD